MKTIKFTERLKETTSQLWREETVAEALAEQQRPKNGSDHPDRVPPGKRDLEHPQPVKVVHHRAPNKVHFQCVVDPNLYFTVCFSLLFFFSAGEATSRLDGRHRGCDGAGGLYRAGADEGSTRVAPQRLSQRLPSPQLPHPHFPITLSRPGAGVGVWGAGDPHLLQLLQPRICREPPATSAAPLRLGEGE